MRSGAILATAAKPASSQVRRALWSGLTRTSVNVIPSSRPRSDRALSLAPLGQWDIGPSRVPALQRPRRLAVTGQVNLRQQIRPRCIPRRDRDRSFHLAFVKAVCHRSKVIIEPEEWRSIVDPGGTFADLHRAVPRPRQRDLAGLRERYQRPDATEPPMVRGAKGTRPHRRRR